VITEAELYKPYEKILLPFDGLTWYLLLMTFGIAFGAIFAVSRLSRRWQDVVYGQGVRMPAYNVVGTFFGISQMRLPRTFFARFILINFIWFSLIFRTAYQGVFFELFTTDMHKPQPKTFNDLIKRNYTIKGDVLSFITIAHRHQINPFFKYTLPDDFENEDPMIADVKSQNYRDVHGNFEFLNDNDTDILVNICDTLRYPSAKTAYLVDLTMIERIKRECKFEPEILEEVMYENVVGVRTKLHHYLFSSIADVTQRLVEAGIVQNWYDFLNFVEYRAQVDPEDKSPKVLTLKMLSFGFVIWLSACSVAVAVLFAEIIWCWIFGKAEVKRPVEVRVHPTLEAEEEEAPVDTEKITRMFRVIDAEEPRLPTIAEECLEDIEEDDERTVAIEMPEAAEEGPSAAAARPTASSQDEDEVSVISFRSPLTVYAEVYDELFLEDFED
jgi:hypothetical protein